MRIALIDDAAFSRTLFTRIASALDHEVVAILEATPHDVVRVVREVDPDLVVLDGRFGAPLGTDTETIERTTALVGSLREAVPRASIAIVAALGETTLVRGATAMGAGFVIPRPFAQATLLATLAAAAEGSARSS